MPKIFWKRLKFESPTDSTKSTSIVITKSPKVYSYSVPPKVHVACAMGEFAVNRNIHEELDRAGTSINGVFGTLASIVKYQDNRIRDLTKENAEIAQRMLKLETRLEASSSDVSARASNDSADTDFQIFEAPTPSSNNNPTRMHPSQPRVDRNDQARHIQTEPIQESSPVGAERECFGREYRSDAPEPPTQVRPHPKNIYTMSLPNEDSNERSSPLDYVQVQDRFSRRFNFDFSNSQSQPKTESFRVGPKKPQKGSNATLQNADTPLKSKCNTHQGMFNFNGPRHEDVDAEATSFWASSSKRQKSTALAAFGSCATESQRTISGDSGYASQGSALVEQYQCSACGVRQRALETEGAVERGDKTTFTNDHRPQPLDTSYPERQNDAITDSNNNNNNNVDVDSSTSEDEIPLSDQENNPPSTEEEDVTEQPALESREQIHPTLEGQKQTQPPPEGQKQTQAAPESQKQTQLALESQKQTQPALESQKQTQPPPESQKQAQVDTSASSTESRNAGEGPLIEQVSSAEKDLWKNAWKAADRPGTLNDYVLKMRETVSSEPMRTRRGTLEPAAPRLNRNPGHTPLQTRIPKKRSVDELQEDELSERTFVRSKRQRNTRESYRRWPSEVDSSEMPTNKAPAMRPQTRRGRG